MINFTKLSDTNYIINYKKRTFKIDSLEKLFVYGLAFGIKLKEIEFAILEMSRMDHNYCEFGVMHKRFVYSTHKGLVN